MMVFMPMVLFLIGEFCPDMIGSQNEKVVAICLVLFSGYFPFVYYLFRSDSFLQLCTYLKTA